MYTAKASSKIYAFYMVKEKTIIKKKKFQTQCLIVIVHFDAYLNVTYIFRPHHLVRMCTVDQMVRYTGKFLNYFFKMDNYCIGNILRVDEWRNPLLFLVDSKGAEGSTVIPKLSTISRKR